MNYYTEFIVNIQLLNIQAKEFYIKEMGYIKEVTPEQIPNLPFPKKKFLDLSYYNQYERRYESEIRRLQQKAITEFLNFPIDSINLQLKFLDQLEYRISKAMRFAISYGNKFFNGRLNKIDLEIELYPLFEVPPHEEGSITQEFIFDLSDAIMFKHGALLGFISQVRKALNLPEKEVDNDNEGTVDSITDIIKNDFSNHHTGVQFLPEKIDEVLNQIGSYFPRFEKELKELFNGGKIKGKVLFNGSGSQLAHLLGLYNQEKYIRVKDVRFLEAWLIAYFLYINDSGVPENFKKDSHYEILRNKRVCKNAILKVDTSRGRKIVINE